jgi:uncharacterized protein with beta-barrel porin domain
VVVAPPDGAVYSEQAFAFAEFNQAGVADLLNRPLADGGGDSFYNFDQGPGPKTRLWARVEGDTLSTDHTAAGPSSHVDGGGLDGGFDVAPNPNTRVGLAFGYAYDQLGDREGGRAHQTVGRVSLYGSETLGGFGLSAVLSYDHADEKVYRPTGIGLTDASFGADEFIGAVQISRPFDYGGFKVTPDAGVQIARVSTGSFSEGFSLSQAFAVTGGSGRMDLVQPYAEIGFSRAYVMASGVIVTPDLQVGYRYDGGAKGENVILTAADGTVFAGNRAGFDRDTALFRFGMTFHEGGWSGFVKYKADLASGWVDQSAQLGVRLAF